MPDTPLTEREKGHARRLHMRNQARLQASTTMVARDYACAGCGYPSNVSFALCFNCHRKECPCPRS